MDTDFVRTRITRLRMDKGVSEYQMSLDLGMSKGYIQSISSGKALPSLKQLYNIFDYFGISPMDFFDDNPDKSRARNAIWEKLDKLNYSDLKIIDIMIDHLLERQGE